MSTDTGKVTVAEIVDHFRKALRGEVDVRLFYPEWTWEEAHIGDVKFWIGDWQVTFFNDAAELDYTDHVLLPDGRRANYDDWCDEAQMAGCFCPLDFLTGMERVEFEDLVEKAR